MIWTIRIAIVFILGLSTCKVLLLAMLGPSPLELDARGYWELARIVGNGDLFMIGEPIAYRTPMYPWFLALVQYMGYYSFVALVILQIICSLTSMVLAAVLTKQLLSETCSERSANWGGVLALTLLLPQVSSIVYVGVALTETLFTTLLMIHLVTVRIYWKSPSRRNAVWVGLTYGLALLTRPVVLMLGLASFFCFLVDRWMMKKVSVRTLSLSGKRLTEHLIWGTFALVVVVSPWLARNYLLFGDVFLTEFMGRNVWIVVYQGGAGAGLPLEPSEDAAKIVGLFGKSVQEANEQSIEEAELSWRATWQVSNRLTASGMNDPEADRCMKRVAVQSIQASPLEFAQKWCVRCVNFWRTTSTFMPALGTTPNMTTRDSMDSFDGRWTWRHDLPWVRWWIDARWSNILWFNSMLLLVMIASVAVCLSHHSTRPIGIWLASLLLYFTILTAAVEIPAYRYRLVLEPLVATLIATGVVCCFCRCPLTITNQR